MRFVIYGAGGIGGTIGARLHQSGYEVVLIARGEHYQSIRKHGLRFVSPKQDVRLNIRTVEHPAEIEWKADDVVMLCMKGQHTSDALVSLQKVASNTTSVVCCQNGVANERMALRRFSNVYAMCVLVPAEHLEPGIVVSFAEGTAGALDVGRYPSGLDQTSLDISSAIQKSGYSSVPDGEVMRHKYAKLLGNLNNAVQAACGEASTDLSRKLRTEALACYEAAKIECANREETRRRRMEIRGGPVPGFRRHGGSSLQSVIRNTGDIEVDFLNGEIVQLGRLHDIATPANLVVQRIGHEAARAGKPGSYCSIHDLKDLVAEESH